MHVAPLGAFPIAVHAVHWAEGPAAPMPRPSGCGTASGVAAVSAVDVIIDHLASAAS